MSLFNNILFEISKHLKAKESFNEDIAKIISNQTGVVIKSEEIKIKDGVLFINTSPTIKTVVYLKKDKILDTLKPFKIKSFI